MQLRILSGLHAQAHVPMPEAGQTLRMGRNVDNDVILRDAPFEEAELQLVPTGCQLTLGGHTVEVAQGLAMQIASLAWVVQPAHAPWPLQWDNALRLDTALASTTDESILGDAADSSETSPPPRRPTLATDSTPESPLVQMPEPAPRPWLRYGAWACSMGLVVGLFAWSPWLSGPQQAAMQATPADSTARDKPADVSVAELEKLLKDAGWGDTVRVKPPVQGVFALLGVVNDMEQVDEVLRLLSNKTRRIQPGVLTQAEFEQRLNALQPQLPEGLRLSAQPGGRILLQATAASKNQLTPTRQWLLAEVPEASGVDLTSPSDTDSRKIFSGHGRWDLPTIVSVQSGANGYVMLANGNKVLPGGYLDTLKLSSIEDDTLVLQDNSGQLLRVKR